MRTFRPLIALGLALSLVLPLVGCGQEDVAAIVNGEEIALAELDKQVNRLMEQSPEMFEGADGQTRINEFKRQLLQSMIDNLLVRQAAAERGITVPESEIDAQFEELKHGFPTVEDFNTALAEANMTVEDLRQQLRDQLVTQRLMEQLVGDAEVTEAEIAEYYEQNKAEFEEQAAVRASHILFNKDDKATAERILAEVNEGGDFAALAREHSKDPGSAAQGGDLGWSDPAQPYVAEFQSALDQLDVGQVSGLVETEFGWHVIRVEEKRDTRVQTLDEVSDQIEQDILQERNIAAYQEFLAEIRGQAEIEILVEELRPAEAGANAGAPGDSGQ